MNKKILSFQVLIIMALGGISLQAQYSERSGSSQSNRRQTPTAIAVSAGEIAANPNRYDGRNVLVRAEIGEVLSPHAFALDEDRLLVSSDLLVIVPLLTPYAMAIREIEPLEGQTVTVAGPVRFFNRGQFEREFPWFSINLFRNPDRLREWDGRPVVIAESLRTQSGQELVHPIRADQDPRGRGVSAGANVGRGSAAGGVLPLESLQQVIRPGDPKTVLNARVELLDLQVQRVLPGGWVVVGREGQDLILVNLPVREHEFQIGDLIDVDGVVRRLPDAPGQPIWMEEQLPRLEQDRLYISARRFR